MKASRAEKVMAGVLAMQSAYTIFLEVLLASHREHDMKGHRLQWASILSFQDPLHTCSRSDPFGCSGNAMLRCPPIYYSFSLASALLQPCF